MINIENEDLPDAEPDAPIVTTPVETKFWIHQEGWIYVGDKIKGARAATEAEVDTHFAKLIEQ
ncbi:hypothetical protein AB9H26_06685 [Yersinia enterocolitica]|uniref:hypothetical protein n=1 Tax=Yersinia enterocolitica TaxID=630 RepID=UPI00330AF32D|nr:hypothetical protein [Yersinia enterocolitica]